jgi:hypothetical protein
MPPASIVLMRTPPKFQQLVQEHYVVLVYSGLPQWYKQRQLAAQQNGQQVKE